MKAFVRVHSKVSRRNYQIQYLDVPTTRDKLITKMVELKSISVNKRLFPNSPVPPQSSDLEANGDASMDIVMVSECSYNMEDNDTMDINEA